eukprot:1367942-Amphidinium_carterae.1
MWSYLREAPLQNSQHWIERVPSKRQRLLPRPRLQLTRSTLASLSSGSLLAPGSSRELVENLETGCVHAIRVGSLELDS